MSRFHGPQGKGALRRHREKVRARNLRRAAIHQHARITTGGKPMLCTPTRAEKAGLAPRITDPGNDNKVIYDTREQAEACARTLEAIGLPLMHAYQCKRGKRGHHHLTHELPANRGRGQTNLARKAPCNQIGQTA